VEKIRCSICGKEVEPPDLFDLFDLDVTDFVCEDCQKKEGNGVDWQKAAKA